jgi:uncharacterized protein (DUF1330 family)
VLGAWWKYEDHVATEERPMERIMSSSNTVVYCMSTFDIVDPERFKEYPVLADALLPKYGGQLLAADTSAHVIEGEPRTMNAIIRFPSKEAAIGFYSDPEYLEAKRIRHASARNHTLVLVRDLSR